MAGELWMYDADICDGYPCPKDCDKCSRAELILEKEEHERNLGDGLMIICDELHDKLIDAAWRLESDSRTIINVDGYDVTVLIRALNDYMQIGKNH